MTLDKKKYWENPKGRQARSGDYPVLQKLVKEGTKFNRARRRSK